MSRILDVEEIDAALKRAANKAIHGTREERSGRLLVVSSVEYDAETHELLVTFTNGKTYRYLNIPVEVYDRFIGAESKGEFFNDNIKGSFVYAETTSRLKR